MHSYCHRQRTCHGLPLSKKTKTKQKPLALSTTAVRSFVTNPNEQHIQTFLWTDYSPSHANTRTGSICALCFKQLQTLFCTWKSPSKTHTHIKKSSCGAFALSLWLRAHGALQASNWPLLWSVDKSRLEDSTRYSHLRSSTQRSRVSVLRSAAKPPELLPTPAGARWR